MGLVVISFNTIGVFLKYKHTVVSYAAATLYTFLPSHSKHRLSKKILVQSFIPSHSKDDHHVRFLFKV